MSAAAETILSSINSMRVATTGFGQTLVFVAWCNWSLTGWT